MKRSHGIGLGGGMGLAGLIVALGVTGWAIQARLRLEAERDGWVKRSVEAAAKVRAGEETIARARVAEDELAAALKQIETAQSEDEKARESATAEPDDGAILAAHPELRVKFERAVWANVNRKYAPLFARLALSAEQSEGVRQLHVRDVENQIDLEGVARTQGGKEGDPALDPMRARQWAELAEAEQKILGPEAFRALQEFKRGDELREGLEEVAGLTVFSSTPLTQEQTDRLVAMLTEAGPGSGVGGKVRWEEVDWETAFVGAAAFLSETQLAALRAHVGLRQIAQKLPEFFEGKP